MVGLVVKVMGWWWNCGGKIGGGDWVVVVEVIGYVDIHYTYYFLHFCIYSDR